MTPGTKSPRSLSACLALVGLAGLAMESTTSGQIVSINWGAQNSRGLGLVDGTDLAIGSLVRIGAFTIDDVQIRALWPSPTALDAAFVEYGRASIGDDVLVAGHWNSLSVGSTESLGLVGERIYLWAFDAPVLGLATQHGIFSSSLSDWTFPSDGDIPNTRTIDLEQVDEVLVGQFGIGTSDATGAPLYNLAQVPEPAETLLVFGGLGVLSVLWRGWRRYPGLRVGVRVESKTIRGGALDPH